MNDKEVNELVKKLDIALGEHNLTFDEYLLYRAIHLYENRNHEIMKSLEDKGFIKDDKVVDPRKLDQIHMSLGNFFKPSNSDEPFSHDDYMRILSFMYMTKPPGKPW